MPRTPPPPLVENGHIRDNRSGLFIPKNYTAPVSKATLSEVVGAVDGSPIRPGGFGKGYAFDRDSDTLAVYWPQKGSGYDELVAQAIVDGTVANVGLSPVVAPQISALVRRQQNQAATASVDLVGRMTPLRAARDAIGRFNDSPLGATDALKRIVYGMCTYNRGAPIATVPITYAFDQWADFGLSAVPLVDKGETESSASRFYLEVDWEKHGTPVPFLPSIYELAPSGIQEWPYWYRVKIDGALRWVLLHSSHIIEFTPGTTSMPGIGTSPVWLCLGRLAEEMLVIEERAEKLLYTNSESLILIGGVDEAGGNIEKRMQEKASDARTRGFVASKPPTIVVSPSGEKVSIATVSFRQPTGVDFEKWRQYNEDVIAACFNEALSALVIRGGVGYGAQAETVADNAAESGVGTILHSVGQALGAIYPRVQVSVSRPNDRAQRLNIRTLTQFAAGARSLYDIGALTADEIRSMVNRDIMPIPETGDDTAVATANSDDSEEAIDTNSGATTSENDGQRREPVKAEQLIDVDDLTPEGRRDRLKRRRQYATLVDDGDVTITDEDVEVALQRARNRVSEDLYDLLTAMPVSE